MKNFYPGCILLIGCICIAAVPSIAADIEANASESTNGRENIHAIEEVLITGLPFEQGKTESALPIHVLAGDALRENAATTLGDTLAQQPGLRSASFGSGVGRPVIRGQGSTRVRVLQNGTGTLDVSAVSPDHGNAVEPLIARQIEVIRGPATLLYGSGAIGGVVNVVDNRIPQAAGENELVAEYRHNSVNHGDVVVSTLDHYYNNFAWHVDFTLRDSNDTSIPGFAAVEEPHEEDEEHEEEEHEEENTWGYIGNSQQESSEFAAGLAWINEASRLGFSISHLENNYGIPPGVHEHHDEEEGEEEHEEEAEDIRLDLEQDRFEFEAGLENIGFIQGLDFQGNYTDYQHQELTAHEAGTLFSKQGFELRSSAQLATRNKSVIGLQLQKTEFDNVGEEAYLPATEQQAVGLFGLYNVEMERWIIETGFRVERDRLGPENSAASACENTSTSWSGSASGIYALGDDSQFVMSWTHSERAPAMEELYSNIDAQTCSILSEPIAHFATGLIEVGNPALRNETSGNVELSLRKNAGDIRGEFTLFQNSVKDYIYLQIVEGEEQSSAYFSQADATFFGVEASLTLPLLKWRASHVDFSLNADYVEATFDHADASTRYLPRIPPARVSMELAWWSEALHIKLRVAENMRQDKLAVGESITSSYTRVDMFSEYHWGQSAIFLKLNNLLDEEMRDHTSYIKDAVPEPGRGIEVGTRIYF